MVITRKLAHKVQNDLAGIMGYIEVAKVKWEEGKFADAYEHLEKAKKMIHTLSHMLNNRIKEEHEI
ncbi:MAG TPA: hypothetical protein VNZ45_05275 [Bacteroidia bacterium]|jgi:hypothetical protein|nr:hypothetical protein [Bacteroidia bacterium]